MWRDAHGMALPDVTEEPEHQRMSAIYDAYGHRVYAYALRLFGDTDEEASQVQVTGTFRGTDEPIETVLDLDAASKAFGLVLPGSSNNPWATAGEDGLDPKTGLKLAFLDSSGDVVATRRPGAVQTMQRWGTKVAWRIVRKEVEAKKVDVQLHLQLASKSSRKRSSSFKLAVKCSAWVDVSSVLHGPLLLSRAS